MAKFDVGRRGINYHDDEMEDLSISGSSWDAARQEKFLEEYDEEMDKLILQADNVAEAYRAYRTGNFRKILETVDKLNQHGGNKDIDVVTGMFSHEGSLYEILKKSDAKLEEILDKQNLSDPVRMIEKDPESARAGARARLAYCNDMVKLFQKMLQINRDALNLSAQEANTILAGLEAGGENRKTSIKMAKMAVMKNKEKFKTNYGYDFTSLGGGRVYIHTGATGLEGSYNIENLIQYGMRYDATVLSHGSGAKKGSADAVGKYMRKMEEITNGFSSSQSRTKYLDYVGDVNALIKYIVNDNVLTDEMRGKLLTRIRREVNPIVNKLESRVENDSLDDQFSTRIAKEVDKYNKLAQELSRKGYLDDKYKGRNADWVMGTIVTEWGQKYNDVVKLIKDLIAHGHKKINILACNPGEVDLSKIPEIKSQPGVHIAFTPTTHLVETPIRSLIDAYHNEYLNEDLKGVWLSIKNFIKKAWEKIKAAFVKLGQAIVKGARALKEKIVKFVNRFRGKKPEKKTRHISIDPTNGAVTDKETTDPGSELKKQAENIERTGKIMDQIKNQQDMAFKQYMALIDTMIQRGNEMLEESAYIEAAKIMETYCRLASASAAGENLVSDEIFDEKSKEKLQTIEGEA